MLANVGSWSPYYGAFETVGFFWTTMSAPKISWHFPHEKWPNIGGMYTSNFQVPAPNTTSSWLHIWFIYVYVYVYICVYIYIYCIYIYIYYIHVYPIIYPHECLMKSKCLSFKQHFQVQPDIRPVISNARQLFPALEYWVGRGLVHLFIGLQMEGTNSEGMDDAWWLRHGGCVPQIPGWEENTVW